MLKMCFAANANEGPWVGAMLLAVLLLLCAPPPLSAQSSSAIKYRYPVSECPLEANCPEGSDAARMMYVLYAAQQAIDSTFARFPAEVTVEGRNCGAMNAGYDGTTRTITFCYELFPSIERQLELANRDKALGPLTEASMNRWAAEFFLMHELGHAVIQVAEIPIPGNEELAADAFAAWLSMRTDKRRLIAAQLVYTMWDVPDEVMERLGHPRAYGTIHPNLKERSANLACWLGFRRDRLPADRAAQCEEEWDRIDKSWTKLLRRYL